MMGAQRAVTAAVTSRQRLQGKTMIWMWCAAIHRNEGGPHFSGTDQR